MAYSDGIRKQRFNPDTAADLIDALLVSKDVMLEQNSAQTTASATPATISGLSQAVTIASGEQVKLTFQGSLTTDTDPPEALYAAEWSYGREFFMDI